MLEELDTFDEKLDEIEFIESSLVLLQGCTINERNTIIKFGKFKKQEAVPFTFKPSINQTSSKIA
jgi:hypothetical protein